MSSFLGAGGGGSRSTSDCFASTQLPDTHCQPPEACCQRPGSQTLPGGGMRQQPLTQRKLFRSSSHCQYPGIHCAPFSAGFCSGGTSLIGAGGCFGRIGAADGGVAGSANASWTGPRAWTSAPASSLPWP